MWTWIKSWFGEWRQQLGYRLESRERDGHWATVRKRHLAAFPNCIACGREAETVHHGEPQSRSPSRELDETNLWSYCNRDHLLMGHLGNFYSYNPEHKQEAEIHHALVAAYREKTRLTPGLISNQHVVYSTVLDQMEKEFSESMTPHTRKALRTLELFVKGKRTA